VMSDLVRLLLLLFPCRLSDLGGEGYVKEMKDVKGLPSVKKRGEGGGEGEMESETSG
jgi:hypothetical protein